MVKLPAVNPVQLLQEKVPDLATAKKVFFAPVTRVALPVVVFALVFGLTAVFSRKAGTFYTASARIWVQPYHFQMGSVKGDEGPSSEENTPFNTGPNALVTASEIMHSESVATTAHNILAKEMGDRAPSVEEIKGSVHDTIVTISGDKTDILDVKYTGFDEKQTVKVLNAVVAAFFEENNRQATNPLQNSRLKLEQQLRMAKDQYSKSKQKVQQFQDATSVMNFERDSETLASEKNDLEREIVKAQNEAVALKGKLTYDEKQLGFGPEDIRSFQKLSADEVMEGLRKSIAETQVKLVDLRSKYQDEHPKIKRLKAQLEEAKKEMNDRYTQLLGSGEHKIDITAVSEAQTSLISDMITSNTSLVALEATIRSLNSTLGKVRSKIGALPQQQKELADIHRADELATGSLTSIERALQRVRLDESVADGSKNLQIIDAPAITMTLKPNDWPMVAGISFAAALAVAALQFFLAPKFISAKRLDSLAPSKTVGFLPPLKGDALGFSVAADRLKRALGDWLNSEKRLPIVITSSDQNDGKSTVAYTLAESLADSGSKVLLIDADCSHPTLHAHAGISASPGLVQYLSNNSVDAVRTMSAIKEGLTIIPAGGVTDVPVLNHPRFALLMSEVAKAFDAVIIDSPDCGDGLESLTLPDVECRLLVIARLGKSSANRLANVITQLEMVTKLEWGIIANGSKQSDVKLLRPAATVAVQVASAAPASEASMTANW